jgi:hypothetical protein
MMVIISGTSTVITAALYHQEVVLKGSTNGTATVTLTTDGSGSYAKAFIPELGKSMVCSIGVCASYNGIFSASWYGNVTLRKGSTHGSLQISGLQMSETTSDAELVSAQVSFDVDSSNGALIIQCTGVTNMNPLKWVARISTVEA